MELRQVEVLKNKATTKFDGQNNIDIPAQYMKGTFHGWENFKNDDYSCKYAIIELENGEVGRYEINDFKFTEKPAGANIFEEGLPE